MNNNASNDYRKFFEKKIFLQNLSIPLLFFILVAIILFSITIGAFNIKVSDIYFTLIDYFIGSDHGIPKIQSDIILKLRMPRVLWAVTAGMGFGLTGALMQTVLRNPLASPFTLGISSGANFGVAVAIVAGLGTVGDTYSVIACAFMGSLIASFIIIGISTLKGGTIQILVLSGIGLNYILRASGDMLEYMATPEQLESTRAFSRGELGAFGYQEFLWVAPILAAGIIIIIPMILDLNAIVAGEEKAGSLGIKTGALRIRVMLLISLLVSSIVAFVGPIGFIGLISPHIVRSITGLNHKLYLPGSALAGAVILLLADTLGMNMLENTVIPVGVMTSFVGVPFFLYFILKERRKFW